MDEIKSLNIEQKSKNYFSLKNGRKNIKLKINKILCPFGLDEEYGNLVFKFEIDKNNINHIELIEKIKEFEEKLKSQFQTNNEEWKSLICVRENENIFLETKVKKMKNNILTKLTFDDKNENYLKTIYELNTNFICDLILEIPTLWDFRNNNNENNENKIGLILNLNNINVY